MIGWAAAVLLPPVPGCVSQSAGGSAPPVAAAAAAETESGRSGPTAPISAPINKTNPLSYRRSMSHQE